MSTFTCFRRRDTKTLKEEIVDIGPDAKGRVRGVKVTLYEDHYSEPNNECGYRRRPEDGDTRTSWRVRVQSTRDGREFGAWKPGTTYDDLDEARAVYDRKIKEKRR